MHSLLLLFIAAGAVAFAQNASPSPSNSQTPGSSPASAKRTAQSMSNAAPPRSDSVNIKDLGAADGESSSNDTQVDLSPPPDDDKAHPKSADVLVDEGSSTDVHPWDPHKSAKDVEVGDFYFKRKNYRAAEDRYREALYYKDNDALATYRLAVCLEKLNRPDEAQAEYENYLKILPHGPDAENAKKAIERLKAASNTKAAK